MKATFLILFMISISNSLKIFSHNENNHFQPENKDTINVQFKKSDIQGADSCDPKDDRC